MIGVFILVLGAIFLVGGLVLLHYLKVYLVIILLLLGTGVWWLFFDTGPRDHFHRHYHD